MIAITGATGFLGSHLAIFLESKRIAFRCLIRKNSPRRATTERRSCEIREVDFNDADSISEALEGCDVLIHALGLINGSEDQLETVNVTYTQRVVEAALKKQVAKLICISSVAALMKHGPYGISKAKGEERVKNSGIPYIILRPAWIFGKRDTHVTEKIIKTLKSFPVVPLLGGGTFKIQPVYVEDAVNLIYQSIHFSAVNSAYTIAGKEQISLRDILKIFCRLLNVKRILMPVPLKPIQALCRVYLRFFPNTRLPVKQILELDKHDAFDISKTVADFAFAPRSFEQGAQAMFQTSPCAE